MPRAAPRAAPRVGQRRPGQGDWLQSKKAARHAPTPQQRSTVDQNRAQVEGCLRELFEESSVVTADGSPAMEHGTFLSVLEDLRICEGMDQMAVADLLIKTQPPPGRLLTWNDFLICVRLFALAKYPGVQPQDAHDRVVVDAVANWLQLKSGETGGREELPAHVNRLGDVTLKPLTGTQSLSPPRPRTSSSPQPRTKRTPPRRPAARQTPRPTPRKHVAQPSHADPASSPRGLPRGRSSSGERLFEAGSLPRASHPSAAQAAEQPSGTADELQVSMESTDPDDQPPPEMPILHRAYQAVTPQECSGGPGKSAELRRWCFFVERCIGFEQWGPGTGLTWADAESIFRRRSPGAAMLPADAFSAAVTDAGRVVFARSDSAVAQQLVMQLALNALGYPLGLADPGLPAAP
eukprot:TRINITY_DN17160_c0_g1_i1.p1 TRINITY_DN17160_c0_g1~~TRINITY_DN17160_c0_g1_i1.p1  ORF type:complete len:420 (+),score=83.82 TRINITY_DN17160_c0_g1_i1:42-1262(+)